MKKLKLLTASMILAASAAVSVPTAASADPSQNPCMLMAGCFWDSWAMAWVCPDPGTYADCYVPAG